jgi:molecular chaperone GrpE
MNRNQRVVPIETARQLLEQRDNLAEQVKSLRSEVDQLRRERSELTQRIDELDEQLTEARQRADARASSSDRQQPVASVEPDPQPTDEAQTGDGSGHKAKRADVDQERARSKRLSAKVQELSSDLQRVRRQSSDASSSAKRSEKRRLLDGLSGLVESIDRGLSMHSDDETRQGLEAMERQLQEFLRRENARLFGEEGDRMDPSVHEAVSRVQAEGTESGEIVHVQRRGLVLDESDGDADVIFPAKVVVAG